MSRFDGQFAQFLALRRSENRLRALRPVQPYDAVHLRASGTDLVNFCSNNYLGLTHHPVLIDRAREWAARWGTGSGASRLVSGTLDLHDVIEQKLAGLKQAEATLLFTSGFQANSSLLPALLDHRVLGAKSLVFSDQLIHASLHHGCAAAGVRQIRYRHNDFDHLKARLTETAEHRGPRFILTESVFSMDGDQIDLAALIELANRYDAFLLLDEAHATGVLGPRGMGLAAAFPGQVDLVLGTFSKALGSFGAYIACSAVLRQYLVNRCAGFIYSTALPPPVLGAIDAALDLVPAMDRERARLHANAARVRRSLRAAGFDTLASTTQIVPAVIGDETATLVAAGRLENHGVLATAIRPPTVPPGTSRIRFSLSAAHGDDDIERLLAAIPTMRP